MFVCGLRSLTVVNLIHGKHSPMRGEGKNPFTLKTYFREGEVFVAFCSVCCIFCCCFVLVLFFRPFVSFKNHFGSRRHLPNIFFFFLFFSWLFHIRSVWTNLQLKPVVAFCGVRCTCFEVCCYREFHSANTRVLHASGVLSNGSYRQSQWFSHLC